MRVALVGTGFGSVHLEWLGACPDLTVTALCYRKNRSRAVALAEHYGIECVTDNVATLVDRHRVEALAVVTPPASHEELLTAGLSGGLAVVSDKPLAQDTASAARLAALANASGLRALVTFQWRQHPALCALRRAVLDGELGSVFRADMEFHHDFLAGPQTAWPWRHHKASAGAGALGDQGVHLFDLLRWLLPGPWRVTSGSARTVWPQRQHGEETVHCETEDMAEVRLTSEDRAVDSRIRVSRVSAGHRTVRVAVHGDRGTAVVELSPDDGRARSVVSLTDTGGVRTSDFLPDVMNPYRLLAGTTDDPDLRAATFEDGLAAQLLLDEALNAIAGGGR
jgi:predicted dehydrogenase